MRGTITQPQLHLWVAILEKDKTKAGENILLLLLTDIQGPNNNNIFFMPELWYIILINTHNHWKVLPHTFAKELSELACAIICKTEKSSDRKVHLFYSFISKSRVDLQTEPLSMCKLHRPSLLQKDNLVSFKQNSSEDITKEGRTDFGSVTICFLLPFKLFH